MARQVGNRGSSFGPSFGALLAGGAIGVFLAPIITPALARMMRPAFKLAIKAGSAFYARGQETAAEIREAIEDAAAELRAETGALETVQPEPSAKGTAPGGEPGRPALH